MIERKAVLHIPLSQYAFATSVGSVTFRLRAARGNLAACTLFYGDRADRQTPVRFTAAPMREVAADELFSYFECTLTDAYERICYYFTLAAGEEETHYYADLFCTHLPPERSEYYQYPFVHRDELSDVPVWFKQAVVYNIFPDSFANGPRSLVPPAQTHTPLPGGGKSHVVHGGTLRGVTANLDYIQALGCNCVYMNPIFTAGEYHRYDVLDYYHIDPSFGTDEEFAALVEAAHTRGMRVIIDGVFNHASWQFFAFQDVVEKGEESSYKDWFYRLAYPVQRPQDEEAVPTYSCFAYERKMPKLNTTNPAVREYFLDVCRHWVGKYHIDGWRLDVANEIDRPFLRAFRQAAKEMNPDCVIIGEVWESAETWLRGDMFDSTMNYDFRKHCREFFAKGALDAYAFDARATMMRMRYPTGMLHGQLNLLDSHDVSRFLSLCGGDVRRLAVAVVCQMLFPGVPSVYYGDEKAVEGTKESEYRAAMPWARDEAALTALYTAAAGLRRHSAVQTGGYRTLHAAPGSMLYAFERADETGRVVAALNAGGAPYPLPAGLPSGPPALHGSYSPGGLGPFGYAVWVQQA